ncbi:hypothetical protein [Brachyspira suanatina]|nr:hypothetical protein [Brachyspira suanatina]
MEKIKPILRYLSIPILIPFIWILRLIEWIQMKKTKNPDEIMSIYHLTK